MSTKISHEELVKDLKAVKEKIGKIPSSGDYQLYGNFSLEPYKKEKFWSEWIEEIFGENKRIINLKATKEDLINDLKEDLINDLKEVAKLLNRIPSKILYEEFGKYSIYKFDDIKWGEWQKMAFGGNMERTNSMRIPEEELFEDIKRVKELIGKIPSKNEYGELGNYCPSLLRRDCSWNEMLIKVFGDEATNCGKAPKKISDEELINNIKELYEKLGRVPKTEDFKLGKYSTNAYKRAFKSVGRAIIAAGLMPNQARGLSDEEILEDIKYVYDKLGFTPSREEWIEHSKTKLTCMTFVNRFGSWNKALQLAGLPIETARNVTQEDIKEALSKWFEKNNKDVRCLEYWKIRKARERREFPYSAETIRHKFKPFRWEEIMWACGYAEYKTIDQFTKRASFPGRDGKIYLSSIEKQVGDYLYDLKNSNKIIDYKYESFVCDDRDWTCDFTIILLNNKQFWLEVDGMRSNRKDPYSSGENEKIKFYVNNDFDYEVISYNHSNIENKIDEFINKRNA